ncbi:alpha/beta hydrolase [Nocardioides marinquilinus]|uniref:Alpha/beta hydrolase n=1 Tax=Nocardioides marinquilinus TaxID=1210400 RepID=A0ABP9P9U2_9ACTN
MTRLRRRGLLGLAGAVALAAAGCGEDDDVSEPGTETSSGTTDGPRRVTYGDDPSQFGELSLPAGDPRGVVVVIHGGFWSAAYGLDLGRPLAASLVEEGWAAWNLEYRRVGDGGGTPATFDDVAAGIDALAGLDLDLSTVVTVGHSAGGHLAVWAAGRQRYGWSDGGVAVTHAVSQAGVLDLVASERDGLGGGAAAALLGHVPAEGEDERYDPRQQVPLDVPVWCVHAGDDTTVPIAQSETYVAAATAAGATAELIEVDGGHFAVIDPTTPAWDAVLTLLDQI